MADVMTAVDYSMIGAYLLLVLALGLFLRRWASRSTEHYFLSGRKLPWWVAGTSMAASAFSIDTPLYVTAITRAGGIGANWEWWCYVVGGMFGALVLAALWRRAGVVTDVEFCSLRYDGKGADVLRAGRAGVFACFVNIVAMGLVLKAVVSIFAGPLGLHPLWVLLPCLAITALYSVLSGFWGVVVTDFLQFWLALIGAILLAVFSVHAAGGLDALGAVIAADGDRAVSMWPSTGDSESIFAAMLMFLGVQWWAFLNADGGGKIIQRQLACRSERDASIATLFFLVTHYVVRTWPWILTALASLVLLPKVGEGEQAYALVLFQVLPEGLRGLMVATLIAAFMSTIDTQLNWGGSYFVNDLYRPYLAKNRSENHYLKVSRLFVLVSLAGAGFVALWGESVTGLFRFLLAMGAGLGPVLLLRWFWWRINAWSELTAMLSSMVVASLCRYQGMALHDSLLVTLAVCLPLTIAVTWLTPPVGEVHRKRFMERTRPPGFWKTTDRVEKTPVLEASRRGFAGLVLSWIGATAGLFLLLFGSGEWLLGSVVAGIGMTLVGAALLFVGWRRVL